MLRDALAICERTRSVVESLDCNVDDGLLKVSCSIGVVGNDLDFGEVDDLLVAADRALYRAKALGRNRVEYHAGGDIDNLP